MVAQLPSKKCGMRSSWSQVPPAPYLRATRLTRFSPPTRCARRNGVGRAEVHLTPAEPPVVRATRSRRLVALCGQEVPRRRAVEAGLAHGRRRRPRGARVPARRVCRLRHHLQRPGLGRGRGRWYVGLPVVGVPAAAPIPPFLAPDAQRTSFLPRT